jgi:hypothetical protein
VSHLIEHDSLRITVMIVGPDLRESKWKPDSENPLASRLPLHGEYSLLCLPPSIIDGSDVRQRTTVGGGCATFLAGRYQKFRSTKPVSSFPLTKRLCERISRHAGIVVLIGLMVNSSKARRIVAMASGRVFWWTISLAMSES